MGGRFPGRFPLFMLIVALVQIFLLALLAATVLVRAGIIYNNHLECAKIAICAVVAFSLVATVLNVSVYGELGRFWHVEQLACIGTYSQSNTQIL